MVHPQPHDSLRILQRQGYSRPDALDLYGLVPAFDFPIRLRIVRRRFHMRYPTDADEFFEVFGNELWAVVGNDSGLRMGKLLASPLENNLYFGFLHRLPDFPVHDVATGAVQHTAQVIE